MASASRGERRKGEEVPSTEARATETSPPTLREEPISERGLANDAESLRGLAGFPELPPRRRRMLRELENEVRMLRVLVEISRATGRSDR